MFRKSFLIVLAALWIGGFLTPAQAQLIVSDGFDYAPGAITGDNGGTGWANAWTSSDANNPNQVTGGGLTFSQNGAALAVSGNKLTTVGDNVGAYRLPPTALGQYGGNNNQDLWFSYLSQNTGSTSGYGGLSLFVPGSTEQFFVGETQGSGKYGFQNSSATAVANAQDGAFVSNTPADGNTHFVVTEINFFGDGQQSNGVDVTLYLDPTPGSIVEDPNQPGHFIPASYADSLNYTYVDSFQFGELRLQSGPDAAATINFDELRMGSNYLDVAPLALTPTPEPGAGSVWLVGAGLLIVVATRRRRRVA